MPRSLTDLAGLNVSNEDFLAAVLNTTAQAILVVDPDDVIRFANPAAIAALGYDEPGELHGRRGHERTQRRITGETVASDLDWFVRRNGSTFPVSYVSAPIEMPEGPGAVVAFSDAEDRLRGEQLRREHEAILAAQRRVATLVAGGAESADVFAVIAREVGHVIGLPLVAVWRYEPDGTASVIGAWSERPHPFQAGTRWPLDGPTICAQVLGTGRPARIDDFTDVRGTVGDAARETGICSCAGAPIIVDGEVWGAMSADSTDPEPLPEHIEDRLAEFTALLAAAISNTASRDKLARLAEEQAALRRVATLVAQGVPSSELFGSAAEEAGKLLGADLAGMLRYESDGTVTPVAVWAALGEHPAVPDRWPVEPGDPATIILQTRRPTRIDDWAGVPGPIAAFIREIGIRSSVGSPIVVDGRLWGALAVHSTQAQPLPADTESRLGNFTDLVATAMANAQARAEVSRLADEHAALRRVATLVARESPPAQVFAAVAEELARLLRIDDASVFRYEDHKTAIVVANSNEPDAHIPVGDRRALEGENVTGRVQRTGRPARIDDYAELGGALAEDARKVGLRSAAGAPIVVEGRLWGVIVAGSRGAPLQAGIEDRIGEFTALVATAISNVEARSELAASRARIIAETDEERRRVVRDLHDGAQQRLVHTVVTLKLACRALTNGEAGAPALVTEALEHAETAMAELRELVHGILPSVLTHGGLRAAIDALASRTSVPVEVAVSVDRLPAAVEATAYFVVAEALTNVAKHSSAGNAVVTADVENGILTVEVRDDGVGGARAEGTGLVGLADRLAALDGRLQVESPADGGTLIAAAIPLAG